ncbi:MULTISPECIES: DUF3014 domain-containing protein [Rheinheimera]|uniref:DUF3014 domain-containing protein n=1 Tax=Rheinheimera marina TaxID=1774958 RepID=A0ABV9JKT7_9GAMM
MTEKTPGSGQQQYYIGLAVVFVTVAVLAWFFLREDSTEPEPTPVAPPVTQTQAEPADVLTANQEPIDSLTVQAEDETPLQEQPLAEPVEVDTVPALPDLDNSDPEVKAALLAMKWAPGLSSLFVTEDMVRRFVVYVDNVAQGTLPKNQPLFQPMTEKFMVERQDGQLLLSPNNFVRYEPYLQLLESISVTEVKQVFEKYYPLMQQAYQELGYPDAQFRDRVQQAIKVLLEAPEVAPPVALEQPNVYYTYADASLQELPLAQRQMIRLGPVNQQRLKKVLQAHQLVLAQP